MQKKSIWLEKLDVATSADVLLMRPDGSVDLLTLGEPAIGGAGRPADVIASSAPRPAVQEEQYPLFVRLAIDQAKTDFARKGITPRVEVITTPGYSQPVFSLPLLVDGDGVVDKATVFTRSSGRTRQRRGCFLRISAPSDRPDDGLLLALEGNCFRAPPTLNEVPRVDVRLVVQILVKVSIPSPPPS